MKELIKVRDMSLKYDISTRALKYYEDMGLFSSTRSDDYAYRMYDEEAVRRLEQVLILRKLNISIKDIKCIFATSSSEVVLEVLGRKVEDIDEEIALLYELKAIVRKFIAQVKQADFSKDSDVKILYEKAKEIENQIMDLDHLSEVSDKLNEVAEKRLDQDAILKKFEALGEEFLMIAQSFFENQMNVSGTAFKLFLHRNTVVDRLDKIKEITGIDLRELSLLELSKISAVLIDLHSKTTLSARH